MPRQRALAGVDEAGRGPLAGPVVAAAVLWKPGQRVEGLADSKTLSARRRETLARQIKAASCFGIGQASVEEIDQWNILQATLRAMARAVAALAVAPEIIIVDGNAAPDLPGRVHTLARGDAMIPEISAASILAKVWRDEWMVRLDAQYPGYGFDRHKGYGTRIHLEALARLGPCPAHRRSFAPVRRLVRRAPPQGEGR